MAMPKHAVLLPGERMRTLGEAWRNLTPEQVQQYHEKSALDKCVALGGWSGCALLLRLLPRGWPTRRRAPCRTRVELQTAGLLPAGGMREFMALPEAQRGEVLELAEAQRRVVALVNEEPGELGGGCGVGGRVHATMLPSRRAQALGLRPAPASLLLSSSPRVQPTARGRALRTRSSCRRRGPR